MPAPATIRINTSVPFPSLTKGSGPITVSKSFGIWTVGFSPNLLSVVNPAPADATTSFMIVYNAITGVSERVPLSYIPSSGGGGGSTLVDLTTTNATPTDFTASVIATAFQSWGFEGQVVARDTATGDTSIWDFKGAIRQGANAAATVLIKTTTPNLIMQDANCFLWGLTITADTTAGAVKVTAQGETGKTIHWEMRLESEHVTS